MLRNLFSKLLLTCLLLLSCAGIMRLQIQTIRDEPNFYNNKKVIIRGQVVQVFALPFVDKGFCKIKDHTGEIWVKPYSRVPVKGNIMTIAGTVKTGFTFRGKTFGIILIEDEPSTYHFNNAY